MLAELLCSVRETVRLRIVFVYDYVWVTHVVAERCDCVGPRTGSLLNFLPTALRVIR